MKQCSNAIMKTCLFCKIINKELPADIVYESDFVIAFKDIRPKAEVHILIVPKRHIISVNHLKKGDKVLIGELILTSQKIAKEKKLKGYKLIFNVGREGGQLVPHLHLHLLSGKKIKLP